ncbi:MAG TPA: DUF58 domain-containing protein [Polyangiales bacterium]|nr:DUF58 domain-containing protein [Polyangiales bacterium]
MNRAAMRFWPARQPKALATSGSGGEELFDEAFQKRLEYLALVSRRVFAGRTRAEQRSRKAGAGVEFADYRRYYPGDDYRQIDWNVYGRIDRLVLRLYEQEEDLSVYLLLDCSGSMAFGSPRKLDYGKQIAAALAYVALNHLDRVSVSALADAVTARMPPTRGRHRIFPIFDFLRPLQASGSTRLADAVGTFVAQNKRRGVAVLISDLYDPAGFEAALDRLRYARFEPHVVHLVDPREGVPSARGDVELIDAETGERRQATLTPRLLERYAQAYRAHQERVASACVQKQVGLFALDVRTPVADAMLHLLRRGGLVT